MSVLPLPADSPAEPLRFTVAVSPLAFPDVSFPVERLIGHGASR